MPQTNCQVNGCQRNARSNTSPYCEAHYYRIRRNGTLELKAPKIRRNAHGYIEVKAPKHPLARAKGWLYEHRAILYDHIGPGYHECTYCKQPITWDKSYPEDSDALCVDHVDGNKHKNNVGNLVPCCALCNIKRIDPSLCSHKPTAEQRAKQSVAQRKRLSDPQNHPMFGKSHSPESRSKMSVSAIRRHAKTGYGRK